MTDLQASLIVIGIALIIAVIAYNKWQENKERKNVEKAFSTPPDDVLMGSGADTPDDERKREPVFQHASAVAESEASPPFQPETQAVPDDTELPPVDEYVPHDLPIDDVIDCAIPMLPDSPLRGEKILNLIQGLRHIAGKPVHYLGERADGAWELVAQGGAYSTVVASVQLANRAGMLNELEYSELISRLRQIADELGAELEVPDMQDVIARSRALHEFIVEYDAKLSINLQASKAPWALDTLLLALERQGFDRRPDGRLVMPDGDNGVLFSVSTNANPASPTTSHLTLLLDVPGVAPLRDGFGAMVACAKSLASRLDGVVVDDAGQLLADEALAEISSQITAFYESMEQAGISAGSTRATRLFN